MGIIFFNVVLTIYINKVYFIMKISRTQLKQIVKEELERALLEEYNQYGEIDEGKLAKIAGGLALGLGTLLGTASCNSDYAFGGQAPENHYKNYTENADTIGYELDITCNVTDKYVENAYAGPCKGNKDRYVIRGIYNGKEVVYDKGRDICFNPGQEYELTFWCEDDDGSEERFNDFKIGEDATSKRWHYPSN